MSEFVKSGATVALGAWPGESGLFCGCGCGSAMVDMGSTLCVERSMKMKGCVF